MLININNFFVSLSSSPLRQLQAVPSSSEIEKGLSVITVSPQSNTIATPASNAAVDSIDTSTETITFIDEDYEISKKYCLKFMRDGHLQIKNLFKTSSSSSTAQSSLPPQLPADVIDSNQAFTSGISNSISRTSKKTKKVVSSKKATKLSASTTTKNNILTDYLRPSIIKILGTDTESKLAAYRHKVCVLLNREDAATLSLAECESLLTTIDQTDIPFMQLFNIWKKCPIARSISHSPVLGRIIAYLLNVDSVRLYQDSEFVKRTGDGPTLWHSDLNMAPFDTNDVVTLWIPLQDVPRETEGGSGLSFATGSHRDFALPYWNDLECTDFSERYPVDSYDGYSVGDVSFHHGWCLHSAPGNKLPESRYAYTVSYIADNAPLLQEEGQLRLPDNEDYQSYADWIDDIGWGGYAEHPLTPLIFQRQTYRL